MKYYYNLYMNPETRIRKLELMKKLNQHKTMWNQYVIALASHGKNQLEIFDSVLLQQKIFQMEDYMIVGIGDGFDDALELVQGITQEVYDATGKANIRDYLLERQKDYEERDRRV